MSIGSIKFTSVSLIGENDKVDIIEEVKKPVQNTKHTSPYIVAYFDLLGTTKKIQCDVNDKYLNTIHKAILYVKNLPETDSGSTFIKQFQHRIKTKIFSDNILIAIPVEKQEEKFEIFAAMIKIVAIVQTFLLLECDWLSRGAITSGDLFIDENFVWGKALVNSYGFESKMAIYPRVIVDPAIMNYYHMPGQESALSFLKNWRLIEDQDGLYFVSMTSVLNTSSQFELLGKIKELCSEAHKEETDYKVIQKFDWLRKTYLSEIDNRAFQ